MSRLKEDDHPQKGLRLPYQPLVWFVLIATLALILTGCGMAGGGSLHVKSPDAGDKDIAQKSGYTFAVTKTFTDINQKISQAPAYNVYAANYDLDSSFFARTLQKPLTSDDQIRIEFSLVGDEGGTEKSPLKVGTYSAKADKFMKVESVAIVTRKGGQDNKQLLDRNTLSGDVKLSSVSGGMLTGEIDLTSGDMSIKGPFTAKILVR